MAGEMESYCKRQLDETYRPGHTAVAGEHTQAGTTASARPQVSPSMRRLSASLCLMRVKCPVRKPCPNSGASSWSVHARSSSFASSSPQEIVNSRTPSCSAQVSLVLAAEQLNFPDAAQIHHYLAAEPSEAGGRFTQFRNAHSKVQSTKSGQAAADRKPPNKFYSALHFMQPILSVDSGSRTSSYNMNEDSDGCLSELNSTFVENNDLNEMSSSSNSPSAITKQTPKRRLLDDTNVHRTALLKQACEYLANTKEDDEFDLWGKSVAATLRNFDAAAVRLAKSKMNIIMASLGSGGNTEAPSLLHNINFSF
ncbi:hypothetical protein ACLKA6_002327 [Drosophila palustris]